MAIKGFKSGHWYVATVRERQSGWNHDGEMDFVLDGLPHKCLEGRGCAASFYDCANQDRMWAWSLDEFNEVPVPKNGKFGHTFKPGDAVVPAIGTSAYEELGGRARKVVSEEDGDIEVEGSEEEWSATLFLHVQSPARGGKKLPSAPTFGVGKPLRSYVDDLLKWLGKTDGDAERMKLLRSFQQLVLAPDVREELEAAIVVMLRKDVFDKWGLSSHFEKGITNAMLLYGVPGTGKTMCAESVAAVLGKGLMMVSSADLQSNVPGQTERNIREIFKKASAADAVVMFDECDSVLADRNSVGVILGAEINALLTEIERFDGVVILTTNRLHTLDPALQRRIIAKVEVKPPTKEARLQIWKNLIPAKLPVGPLELERLAAAEMTGGEIKNAILLAARRAIAENADKVTMEHFERAVFGVLKSKEDFDATRPRRVAESHWKSDVVRQ